MNVRLQSHWKVSIGLGLGLKSNTDTVPRDVRRCWLFNSNILQQN